ncbi:MAG: hypothetical protein PF961_18465 [Planctomycetota bacterium]|jgi:hypothetical protein|nr:hypothetical protein [Planctomycetota bacterium]
MRFVAIRTYLYEAQAGLDRDLLERAGIPALIGNTGLAAANPLFAGAAGEITLEVPDTERQRAEAVLAESRPLDETDDYYGEPDEPDYQANDENPNTALHCPQCDSDLVAETRPWLILFWLLPPLLLVAFPLLWIKKRMCHECSHRW